MNRRERRQRERELDKRYGIPKSQKIETKNTFGCEVSNDYIPKNQMELLGKIGLRNIIKVKRRKNGMTSSMKPNGCHSNVRILVERCGGKQLLGYMICGGGGLFDTEQNGEEPFQIVYHSVWITQEGEVIDPTLSNYETDNERGFTYFSPIFIYQNDGFWIYGYNLIFPKELLEKGFYVCDEDYGGGVKDRGGDFVFPLNQLCWKTTLHSNLFMTKEERIKSRYEHFHDGSGGFTEPSIKEQRLKVG
jgi:hypothetical protein|tara:strand:+ start:852 stop:1592 length:741 start_codon:yes stop_codon:yes gene_type:complete